MQRYLRGMTVLIMFILSISPLVYKKENYQQDQNKKTITNNMNSNEIKTEFKTIKQDEKIKAEFSINGNHTVGGYEVACKISIQNISDKNLYLLFDSEDSITVTTTLPSQEPEKSESILFLSRLPLDLESELAINELPDFIELKPSLKIERIENITIPTYLVKKRLSIKLRFSYLDKSMAERLINQIGVKETWEIAEEIGDMSTSVETLPLIVSLD